MIFVDNENTQEEIHKTAGLIAIDNSVDNYKPIYLICSSYDQSANFIYKIVDLNRSKVLTQTFESAPLAYNYIINTLVNNKNVMVFNKGDLILTRNK